jgi:tight adherence protein B
MKRALVALGTAAVALLATAAPAFADQIAIRNIDTTNFPKVKIAAQIDGTAPDLGSFALRENGILVPKFDVVPLAQANTQVGVVLVIDVSGSMRDNGKLDAARQAANQFIDQKPANEQVAIVAFNNLARVAANFTNNAALLKPVIDGLTATGETALWDGVRLASGLFSDRPDLQPNILLLSDGKDTVSQSNGDQARAAVQSSKAPVYAVGLKGGADFDAAALQSLASASGGQYVEATSGAALAGLYARAQQALQNQYEVSYTSTATTGVVDLSLAANGLRAEASAPIGGVSRNASANQPVVVKSVQAPRILAGRAGQLIITLLVLLAVALFGVAIVMLVVRDPSVLEGALRPYSSDGAASEEGDDEITERVLAESALLRRAVNTTARLARDRGILDRIERKLEQADLALRSAEFLFFWVAIAVVLVPVGFLVAGLGGGVGAAVIFGFGPLAVLNFLATRRRKAFTAQLPNMLQLLSSTLRAGYSLMQAVDAVAVEAEEPIGKELRRVLAESRLGRPLEEALDDAAARMESPDFEWAVMAVGIQREVGGNLAELLDTVKETMIARERLRGEIRALTAEGKISAIVLGILPVGLGGFMWVSNRDYVSPLFHEKIGEIMLTGAVILALAGFFWMKKMIEIEV